MDVWVFWEAYARAAEQVHALQLALALKALVHCNAWI